MEQAHGWGGHVRPSDSLIDEWEQFSQLEIPEHILPGKYRHLMGLAMAIASGCRYCVFYHTEMARMNGAMNEELVATRHYAQACQAWEATLEAQQPDLEVFKEEVRAACEHYRTQASLSYHGA